MILLGNGRTAADVADALLIDPETVRTYFKRFTKVGICWVYALVGRIHAERVQDLRGITLPFQSFQVALFCVPKEPLYLQDASYVESTTGAVTTGLGE